MIDQVLADFVHSAPFFVMGTRDARLRPHGVHLMGGRLDRAGGRLSVFIPLAMGGKTLDDARATGVAAVTVGAPSHETYQFKGEVVEVRPMTDEETAIQDIYIPKLVTATAAKGVPVQDWTFPPLRPGVTVTIQVSDIFVQTPGPRAGTRIGP